MWGANANTHGPKALQGVRQAGDTSTPLRQGTSGRNYGLSISWSNHFIPYMHSDLTA